MLGRDELVREPLGKLLRFLESGEVRRVGENEPFKVDVRIVCATNRDPAEEVRAGRFREDLYYRLHVVPIEMPPLRERGEDVIEIAEKLIERFAAEEDKGFRKLSPQAARALLDYPWPGNVRQLENVLRNAVVLHDGNEITIGMFPTTIFQSEAPANVGREPRDVIEQLPVTPTRRSYAPEFVPRNGAAHGDVADRTLRGLVGATLADVEREFIELTIQECDGSIPRAARVLDVSPSTLYRKREAWERNVS